MHVHVVPFHGLVYEFPALPLLAITFLFFLIRPCFLITAITLPELILILRISPCLKRDMPSYYLQDCHYFYRTALRGLNISTSVSPLYS